MKSITVKIKYVCVIPVVFSLNYPSGEHLFLCGSYSKSADIWRSQICEESNKSKKL